MTEEIKNLSASIRMRLKNYAKKEKKQVNLIYLSFIQERFLYRLSISDYREKFVLKGGILLYCFDLITRPTKDIDFLAQNVPNEINEIKKIMTQICKIEINDGVLFDTETLTAKIIAENRKYNGIRIKLWAYIGTIKQILQIDIGFGDIIIPTSSIIEYPVLLDGNSPKIKVSSIESLIAEKFESMIILSIINSRMKDFYDIYFLSKNKSFQGKILYSAIKTTFHQRDTLFTRDPAIFSEIFVNDKERIRDWQFYIKKIRIEPINFEVIMSRIKEFLQPIYNKLLDRKEFFHKWDHKKEKWIIN